MIEYTLTGSVFTTFDFVGFHRWPDAPHEVNYLQDLHRHLFKVRIDVSVEHHDREIEFHTLKRYLLDFIRAVWSVSHDTDYEASLGSMSCEQMALEIMDNLRITYPDRPYYRVEVSEDGENGSIIEARS